MVVPPAPPVLTGTSISYPSPATGSTVTFGFSMVQSGSAKLQVLNSAGSLLSVNVVSLGAGPQAMPLDIASYAAGVYFYRIELTYADGSVEVLPLGSFAVAH